MPRHVLTMIAVIAAFFGLLWLGVVVFKASPGAAMVVSLLTVILVGAGITFTSATLRGGRQKRE